MLQEKIEQSTSTPDAGHSDTISFLKSIMSEIIYNPFNMGLVLVICYLVYKVIRDRFANSNEASEPVEPALPKMRQDLTMRELRNFDGNQPDGRVLVAVNGIIYDVTKGKRFYGPGGPYATFAGRDASRNLATFSVVANDNGEYDDLSDLTAMEMDSVREWEMQFKEKYDVVGKLLREGEQPTNYEDEDEDAVTDASPNENEEEVKDDAVDAEGVRRRATAAIIEDAK